MNGRRERPLLCAAMLMLVTFVRLATSSAAAALPVDPSASELSGMEDVGANASVSRKSDATLPSPSSSSAFHGPDASAKSGREESSKKTAVGTVGAETISDLVGTTGFFTVIDEDDEEDKRRGAEATSDFVDAPAVEDDAFFLDTPPSVSGGLIIEGDSRPATFSFEKKTLEELNREAEKILSDAPLGNVDFSDSSGRGGVQKNVEYGFVRQEFYVEVFSKEQADWRSKTPAKSPMASEALASFSRFFRVVDEALKTPPTVADFFLLTTLSGTLDREIDLATSHYFPVPSWLLAAVQARSLGIDRLIHARLEALAASEPGRGRKGKKGPSATNSNRRGVDNAVGRKSVDDGKMAKGKNSKVKKIKTKRKKSMIDGWIWPISHPVITSDFGVRKDPFTGGNRMHNGVDIRARAPERVEAIADGTVTRSGENGGHGISVEVLHNGGFTSVYSHLSLALLRVGDWVKQGDAVGISGDTGRSTGPHLHFELWKGQTPVNPLAYLEDEPEFGCEEGMVAEGFWRSCGGELSEPSEEMGNNVVEVSAEF